MNKLNKLTLFSVLMIMLFCVGSMTGQARYFDERYITTQAYLNPVLVNPGAIGQSDYHRLLLNYRNKWATFPGAPKTLFGQYDGPVGNNLGVSVGILSDRAGELQTLKGQGGINYTIRGENNRLGIGVTGEYISHGVDGAVLNNESVDQSDNLLQNRIDGNNFFDVSLGAYGVYDERFIYGIGLPGLINSMLGTDPASDRENVIGYFANVGYIFDLKEYDMKVTPSIWVKSLRYVPLHVDINLLGQFLNEKLTGGVTYTVGADERLGFLAGVRVNSFNFFYGYNVSRHEFQAYNNGSHELSLRFDLGRTDSATMTKVDEDLMEN